MGFKYIENENKGNFNYRLWNLMKKKNINSAKELAEALYNAGYIPVERKIEDYDGKIAISNMARRIQEHLNSEDTQKLQSRYVTAYCDFFSCSADYLFGRISIESGNPDVRQFCKCTGLSEKAVKRMIEELPEDIKLDLMDFWSNMLDSNIFYALPMEYHQMCYELGQYCTAQNQIKMINKVSKELDDSEIFVETWRSMMEENYLKEAEPHAGTYYMHLNSIISNLTEYLEMAAEEYVIKNKKDVNDFFVKKLHEKMSNSRMKLFNNEHEEI